MADLHSLIRLHKHELDEKRRALGVLYTAMAALERSRRDLAIAFDREKEAMRASSGEVHFTFAGYAEQVRKKNEEIDKNEEALQKQIEEARDSLMETFGELKKYEMTQEERDRLAEEERNLKEAQAMDEIGLQGYRRKQEES